MSIDDERRQEEREIEHNDAQMYVAEWVDQLTKGEMVKDLERGQLKILLEAHGAKFDNLSGEEQKKLHAKHYSNPSRSSAMTAVWGDRYQEYKDWCDKYVIDYEERTGKTLPAVKFQASGNESKTEGMRGFFGDLTAYAATSEFEFSYDDLIQRSEARVKNGKLREEGITDKESRTRIVVKGYDKDKPFAPAGFPAEFPQKALSFIESWK